MYKTKINAACYISIGLLGVYISIYQSLLDSISTRFSADNALAGIIIAMHFIGSLTAPLIFGEISDKIGKKPVVVISLSILITGLVAVYFSNSLFFAVAGIFLIGCGFAVIEGTLSGLLSKVNAEQSNRAISISQMFFSIGAVAGPVATVLLTNIFGDWKVVFLFMILLFSAIMLYFILLRFGDDRAVESKDPITGNGGLFSVILLKEKVFIHLLIVMFVYVGIEEGVAFWINTYFIDMFHEGYLGKYALSGYWASMIIGRYLAVRFYNRRNLFLKGGLLLSLLFIVAALLFNNSTLSLVCFVGAGLGFSAVWPAIMSFTADLYPKYTGTAMGMMMTAGAGGGTVIPFFIGAAAGAVTISAAFWIIPVLIVLILLLQMRYDR